MRIRALSRETIARRLESEHALPFTSLPASIYGALSRRRVRRPLAISAQSRVIGVGGATLGGSGKTPMAIAIARALAERGEQVALIGHAYRARPAHARIVTSSDDVREVGDEALLAARMLAPFGAPVIVSGTRQSSVNFAAERARYLVVDGLLQAEPRRLTRSVLALDAEAPWGNARLVPSGNLRAPKDALLEAADLVARLRDERCPPDRLAPDAGASSSFDVVTRIDRARDPAGQLLELSGLAGRPVGIILALARPERVIAALARRGIHPAATITLGDHAQPDPAHLQRTLTGASPVEAWLTTAKCATKLPVFGGGAPLLVLEYEVDLPAGLVSALVTD